MLKGNWSYSLDNLDLDVQIIDPVEWARGDARDVCKNRSPLSMQPVVEVKARSNEADDLATTLTHEYAHAGLRFDINDQVERVYEAQLEAEEGSRSSLDGERALASIERVGEDVRAKADPFEDREKALRERFQQAMN